MSHRFSITFIAAALLISGCDSKKEVNLVAVSINAPTLSPAALSLIDEADALDGKKDHVISKCYVCGLGMDGSDKFAAKTGVYTAHLCSKSCQQEFEKNTEEIVLHTKMPKGE